MKMYQNNGLGLEYTCTNISGSHITNSNNPRQEIKQPAHCTWMS